MFQNNFNSTGGAGNTIGKNYHFNANVITHTTKQINNIQNNMNNNLIANNYSLSSSLNRNIGNNNNNNKMNMPVINQALNSNTMLYRSNQNTNSNLPMNSNKDNASTAFTNMNIFGFNKTNNKFFSNINPGNSMNQQDRVIAFGQDSNENTFKKNLRKPTMSNLIQNTSYNIITGAPYNNNNNTVVGMKYLKNYIPGNGNGNATDLNMNKPEKIENLFYSYRNPIGNNNNNNFQGSKIQGSNIQGSKIQGSNIQGSNISNSPSKNQISNTSNTSDDTLLTNNNTHTKNLSISTSTSTSNSKSHTINTPMSSRNLNPPYETDIHIKDASSVKEYSYKEDANPRSRENMEDKYKIIDKFNREKETGYFSIYDGHGGDSVALYAKDRLPEIFEKLITSTKDKNTDPNYIENLLTSAFMKVDEELKLLDSENVGCTATVAFITKEKDSTGLRRVLYVANVGDSRCVIVSSHGAKRMSYDHKVSDKSEAARILSSGGIIFAGRVYGLLILSRALGDHGLKKHGVIANPFVNKHFITDRDRYVVLASDGVWDVIMDEDVYRLQLTISNSDEFAKLIVKTSMARGSQDNISCIVIKLF